MARKNVHYLRVANRIWDAMEALRKAQSERSYKDVPMNAFLEAILWNFATGRISYAESVGEGKAGLNDDALKARQDLLDRNWGQIPPPSSQGTPEYLNQVKPPRKKKASGE